MKKNIKQICLLTGFSPATVSNALHGKKGVSSQTSAKILKAAKQIGYQQERPVTKIRFITYRKNGFIVDNSLFFPAMMEGVESQAKKYGYETVFSRLDCQTEDFKRQLQSILEDTSYLLILLGTEMEEEDYIPFQNYRGCVILLDGWCDKKPFDGIIINNTDAADKAVEYLISCGHKKIGYLRGRYRIKSFQYREYGYKRAMARSDYPVPDEYQVTLGTQVETAYEDMCSYIRNQEDKKDMPTAFFADNDVIALGAMRAMKENDIRIPEDISIVGFDDISFGAAFTPSLTTVRAFQHEMGKTAVRRAHDWIQYRENNTRMKIQVCTEFIERESVRKISS